MKKTFKFILPKVALKVQKFTDKVNAAVGKFKEALAGRLGKSCYQRGPFFIRERQYRL
ncbi:MAG: hypothetical protein LBF27_04115 [Sphingobacterium sp.]|nr:hypothetical protein [Sphingobacterium sp.]